MEIFMKKSLSVTLSILFAVFLLVTLVLVIVRIDLAETSLSGLVDSGLGVAKKVAGKKTIVPALIKMALSTPFFIGCIVITVALPVIIIIGKKKLSAWVKDVALPVLIDGAMLLIASPVGALIYKAKVPKLAQGMAKGIYTETQKLVLICGAAAAVAGAVLLVLGLPKKKRR